MLCKEMKIKVMNDLEIKPTRARYYVEAFFKKYTGSKGAIKDVSARYTDDGNVEISYTINEKQIPIVVNGNVYSKKEQQEGQ